MYAQLRHNRQPLTIEMMGGAELQFDMCAMLEMVGGGGGAGRGRGGQDGEGEEKEREMMSRNWVH